MIRQTRTWVVAPKIRCHAIIAASHTLALLPCLRLDLQEAQGKIH